MLVVRPEPGAGETIAALAAEGIPALACPPSRIIAADPLPAPPASFDAVVLTSANAARVMGRRLAGWPAWCVGAKTAEAARAAGCAPVHSAEGDGRELAARLAAEPAMTLFHPRGADTALALGPLLAPAGHGYRDAIVYRAEPVGALDPEAAAALAARRVALAAFWSPRGARLFLDALDDAPAAARRALAEATLLALSPAVAEALGGAAQGVVTASRPDGRCMHDLILGRWS
ncbi:MAG: uroporphyrinogen-III synthase [Pseudomonadota bacterium]